MTDTGFILSDLGRSGPLIDTGLQSDVSWGWDCEERSGDASCGFSDAGRSERPPFAGRRYVISDTLSVW